VVAGENENLRGPELGVERTPYHPDLLGKIFETPERADRLGLTSEARPKLIAKRVAQSGSVAIYAHAPM
jgi:hypothetical protein